MTTDKQPALERAVLRYLKRYRFAPFLKYSDFTRICMDAIDEPHTTDTEVRIKIIRMLNITKAKGLIKSRLYSQGVSGFPRYSENPVLIYYLPIEKWSKK